MVDMSSSAAITDSMTQLLKFRQGSVSGVHCHWPECQTIPDIHTGCKQAVCNHTGGSVLPAAWGVSHTEEIRDVCYTPNESVATNAVQ